VELGGVLAEAVLFLAILGFAWQTCGGRQCWNSGFQRVGRREHAPWRVPRAKVQKRDGEPKFN
jgi:hypothetical protein